MSPPILVECFAGRRAWRVKALGKLNLATTKIAMPGTNDVRRKDLVPHFQKISAHGGKSLWPNRYSFVLQHDIHFKAEIGQASEEPTSAYRQCSSQRTRTTYGFAHRGASKGHKASLIHYSRMQKVLIRRKAPLFSRYSYQRSSESTSATAATPRTVTLIWIMLRKPTTSRCTI